MIDQGDQVQLPRILLDLRQITPSNQPLYLVGGAVRDYLLGKKCQDYDIVCAVEARTTAKRFADHFKGAFFSLDEERKTYRVLINQASGQKTVVDFATMQGGTIIDDLAERDFSINAMAVDLNDAHQIIDPNKGGRDLQEKWLRPVNDGSLTADPLRVIRAVRYAVDLDLKIDSRTSSSIVDAASLLESVSIERKRDELFKILDGKKIQTALRLLRHNEVFDHFPMPVKTDFQQVLSQIRELEEILDWLTGGIGLEKQASFHQVSLILELGGFKDKLRALYLAENSSNRTRKALINLSLLLDPVSRERESNLTALLALSVDESSSLEIFNKALGDCERLMSAPENPKPAAIYDFYRNTAATGVDLVIASLACYRTRIGAEFSQTEWLQRLGNAKTLLRAWFDQPEIIHPSPLINGDEIMEQFKLKPGRLIGQLLDGLIHEQLAGNLTTKKEALDWIASRLV